MARARTESAAVPARTVERRTCRPSAMLRVIAACTASDIGSAVAAGGAGAGAPWSRCAWAGAAAASSESAVATVRRHRSRAPMRLMWGAPERWGRYVRLSSVGCQVHERGTSGVRLASCHRFARRARRAGGTEVDGEDVEQGATTKTRSTTTEGHGGGNYMCLGGAEADIRAARPAQAPPLATAARHQPMRGVPTNPLPLTLPPP